MFNITLPEVQEYGFERLLFKLIFNIRKNHDDILLTPDVLFWLQYSVLQLPERKQKIVLLRCKEHWSLRQTGAELGLNPERVRQIENKIIRDFRRHFCGVAETAANIDYDNAKAEGMAEGYQLGYSDGYAMVYKEERVLGPVPRSNMHIDSLNLPVRVHHALMRRGIKTLQEASQLSYHELKQIRNVGEGTIHELKKVLAEYGFDTSHLESNRKDELTMNNTPIRATITPRKPTDRGGYACMPLRANVPEGRPDWKLVTCPECGAECWRGPLVETAEQSGAIALCTMCALKKGSGR